MVKVFTLLCTYALFPLLVPSLLSFLIHSSFSPLFLNSFHSCLYSFILVLHYSSSRLFSFPPYSFLIGSPRTNHRTHFPLYNHTSSRHGHSSWNLWPLKVGPIDWTSIRHYQYILRNKREERRRHLRCGDIVKSRTVCSASASLHYRQVQPRFSSY